MRLIKADKIPKAIYAEDDNITGMGMTEYEMEAYNDGIDVQWAKIKNAPTVEVPKWIPCSERLPEQEEKSYWVCTNDGYQCQCRWTNINHIWTDLTTSWHWHVMDIPQHSKVVAWMPLPEVMQTGDD